jgi:predicted PurR-regulated permease PerM
VIAILLLVLLVVAIIVPAVSAVVARNVINNLDRGPSSGSIDQSLVEARLTRIEEAIDAMAVQIEKLSDHQRSLLGPASRDSRD